MFVYVFNFIFVQSVVFALPARIILPHIQQENPLPDQLVSLRQIPFPSLESSEPPSNAKPTLSNAELRDLCQICDMFTSKKPLDCKKYCAGSLKSKKSKQTGSGSKITPTLGDALCAFCKKYPIFPLSNTCKKKLCSK